MPAPHIIPCICHMVPAAQVLAGQELDRKLRHWAISEAVQVSDLASVSELADSKGVGTQVSRAPARAPRAGSLATCLGKRHSPGRANSRGLCHSRSVGLPALPPYLAGHVRWTRRRGARSRPARPEAEAGRTQPGQAGALWAEGPESGGRDRAGAA